MRRARAADARVEAEATLATVQSTLTEEQEALARAETASAAALAAVDEALGSTVALLTQVADPHFGADTITEALAAVQAGAGDPVTLSGLFRLPVPGAPLGSPYGIRVDPLTGSIGYHPGVDFEAAAGTAVQAAAAGTVVMAGDCGGYGNCVVIDHGHSLATVSAHLSACSPTSVSPWPRIRSSVSSVRPAVRPVRTCTSRCVSTVPPSTRSSPSRRRSCSAVRDPQTDRSHDGPLIFG